MTLQGGYCQWAWHLSLANLLSLMGLPLLVSFQCYLYLFYSPARTVKVVLMLLFICLGNVYLHGLRNLWQILFHIGVAFLSSHQILTRQLQDKQSDCGVWGWGHGMDGSFDFPPRVIGLSPFTSWLHLKFPSSKFLSTKADWSWEPRIFSPVQREAWSCWTPGLSFVWELLQNLQFSTLDSRIWEPSQKAHYWKTNMKWFWSFTLSDTINH